VPLQSVVFVSGHRQATVLTSKGESTVPVRVAMGLDDFAAAVARHTRAAVEVVDGMELPALGPDTILVGDGTVVRWLLGGTGPPICAPGQLVELFGSAPMALDTLETSRLAAVVDFGTYTAWQGQPDRPGTGRLFGLSAVAAVIGAQSWQHRGAYARIELADATLPEALARYLEAYLQGQLPVSSC